MNCFFPSFPTCFLLPTASLLPWSSLQGSLQENQVWMHAESHLGFAWVSPRSCKDTQVASYKLRAALGTL